MFLWVLGKPGEISINFVFLTLFFVLFVRGEPRWAFGDPSLRWSPQFFLFLFFKILLPKHKYLVPPVSIWFYSFGVIFQILSHSDLNVFYAFHYFLNNQNIFCLFVFFFRTKIGIIQVSSSARGRILG
jgi:hypothetical protein